MRNTGVTSLPPGSVNGLKNPVGSPPTSRNGSSATTSSATGTMMRPTSISTAWNTSVRDTARKPPMNVYEVTAKSVIHMPGARSISNTEPIRTAPAIRPELV